MPTPGYEHFVFDLDGTLIDSGDDLAAAVNATLDRLGLPILPAGRVIGFVGHGMRRLLESSLEASVPGRSPELLEAATGVFRESYRRGLLDRTALHGGVETMLTGLARAGVRLSLLTNKPREFTEPILAGLGIDGLFSDLVCGGETAAPKPDPAGALRLVERSGLPAERTVLVGDSAVDVETARRAGIGSCAVTWGLRDQAELRAARPDHLVVEPGGLVPLARA